jgi:putative ABC transport system permease protein
MAMIGWKIPLARKMMTHKKGRLIMSMLGIAFSVIIMFMEIGFFNGINDSQANFPPLVRADLIMMQYRRYSMLEPNTFSRIRIQQALAYNEVQEVLPFYELTGTIVNNRDKRVRAIYMLAFPPEGKTSPLNVPGLDQYMDQLRIKGNVVFDRLSRDLYGDVQPGSQIMLNGRPHNVVGTVGIGPNLKVDGYVIMGDTTMEDRVVDKINMGLLRVKPGTDLKALKKKLLADLPRDILILTPEEARVREVDFTIEGTPTGAVFGAGVIIGFIIGVIICYQILFNEITDQMPQYATMKAVGFSKGFLIRLVMKQAFLLSVFGFIPGLLGGYALYRLIQHFTQILMILTPGRALFIFGMTVFMCAVAGLLAVRKVLKADPAELY